MGIVYVSGGQRMGPGNDAVKFTPEGGLAIRLINKTGSASVKGELVDASPTAGGFAQAGISDDDVFGVVYEAGVADGSECWVVVAGIAQVLLKDTTAATAGNWVKTSDTAGRADATTASPPGLVLEHFQEIGHCIETQTGGTDVLAKVVLHFN